MIEEQLYGEWHRRNVFNALTLQSNARERKRNQTLQLQGKGKLQKEKTEKAIKGDSDDGGVRLGETMTEGAGKPSQKDK